MVRAQKVYVCDCCQTTSYKPYHRIKYRTVLQPFGEVHDLCPDCYDTIQWGYIKNLVRDDLTFEMAKLNEPEDGDPFYEMVDVTENIKEYKIKTKVLKEIENDR